jgi:SAM-dependent methyltransferase
MKPDIQDAAQHWNRVAEDSSRTKCGNPVLARHKRRVYADLITAWTGNLAPSRALKTDLFAEAFNDEEFLSSLPWASHIIGIDISSAVLQTARHRQQIGILGGYVTCDVTRLPFRDGAFDLVISDSTLDHFQTQDEIHLALGEIVRVLSHGGKLILSIDNPSCLTYPPRRLVRLWMRLGLAPYYIGVTLSSAHLRNALRSLGMTIHNETAILHYPHPDCVVRLCERCVTGIGRGRLDGVTANVFSAFERFGNTGMRYLTGRYLAVCATKGNKL